MARSSEALWNRVDLAYVRRLPRFRARKRWLSFAFGLGAIGWVAVLAVREDERPFDSGPISQAHGLIADDCFKCHVEPWRGVKRWIVGSDAEHAMNKACLNCHGTTIAHDHLSMTALHATRALRTASPPARDAGGAGVDRGAVVPLDSLTEPVLSCATCHREHQGRHALLDVSDGQCVRCHGDLRAVHGTTAVISGVRSFADDHPEFRALAERRPDPGRLKLNHAVHLKPNLAGPDRAPVQMTCADCHRPTGVAGAWPYRAQESNLDRASQGAMARVPDGGSTGATLAGTGASMQPIRYALHCAGCHPLVADAERRVLPEGLIPHESPSRIRVVLRGSLSAYADAHPEALEESANPGDRGLPTLREPSAALERLKTAWVNERIDAIERMIYRDRRDCLLCHDQEWSESGDGLPRIVPPDVPTRWFERAAFSHERHRIIACDECHAAARTSVSTVDVLLPGIASCRTCHAPKANRGSGAEHRCVLCHAYHRAPDPSIPSVGLPVEALTSSARGEGATR